MCRAIRHATTENWLLIHNILGLKFFKRLLLMLSYGVGLFFNLKEDSDAPFPKSAPVFHYDLLQLPEFPVQHKKSGVNTNY